VEEIFSHIINLESLKLKIEHEVGVPLYLGGTQLNSGYGIKCPVCICICLG